MAEAEPLTCQQVVKLVSDYLEDSLPPADAERFEDHLRACEGCARYLDQMRKTIRIAGTLTEEDLTPSAREDLVRAFRHWRQT